MKNKEMARIIRRMSNDIYYHIYENTKPDFNAIRSDLIIISQMADEMEISSEPSQQELEEKYGLRR